MTEKRKTKRTKEKVEAPEPDGKGQSEASATVEPVELTFSDLQGLSAVIDLASRRGAFQASEMSKVGEYYNKLNAFLSYIKAQQEKHAESEYQE